MKIIFDGFSPARDSAETESRKNKEKEYWVVKTKEDGIKYSVVDDLNDSRVGDKIMGHYKNGQVVK